MRRKTWVVIVVAIVLTGCSATRLLYNQLDWGLVWYLNGFFSLTSEQKGALRDSVERNMAWHRKTELPKYADFARAVDQDIHGPVTVEMLEQGNAEIIEFWDTFVLHTVSDVAAFFLLLDEDQIDEFVEKLEDENRELWDEYAGETAEERIERRNRSAIKAIRRVMGGLDDDQKELIRSYMGRMIDVSDEWMVGRRIWQAEFVELVRLRPAEPHFSDRLTNLMLDPNQYDSEEYRTKVAYNWQLALEMMADLINQMNDDQRDRFSKRLRQYASDFEALSAQDE